MSNKVYSNLSIEKLEEFINDVLKEDLKIVERCINRYNEQIMEYIQLKNTIQTLKDTTPDGYKTQMDIGANIFMQAKVNNMDKIYVNVGKDYFLEFTMEEALKFANFKVRLLTKECDVLREESVKKRSAIKLAVMCMGEQEELNKMPED